MYILGINPGYDGTATLIKDGKIIAAIGEERLSRIKLYVGFPYLAIKECLRIGRITPKQIDLIAFSYKTYLNGDFSFTDMVFKARGRVDEANEWNIKYRLKTLLDYLKIKFYGKNYIKKAKKYAKNSYKKALKELGLTCPTIFVDHHLAHAASGYYTSGQRDCLIVTADGVGDGISVTTNLGQDGDIKCISRISGDYSPGHFYSNITKYLGFKRHRHEGKITGLAAYGDASKCYKAFLAIDSRPRLTKNNEFTNNIDKNAFKQKNKLNFKLKKLYYILSGKIYYSKIGNYLMFSEFREKLRGCRREDVAAGAQKVLEDLMADYTQRFVKKTGKAKIVLAGGVFANVRLNQKILEIPGVNFVSIHPNMGDGGTATGAALWVYKCEKEKKGEKFYPYQIKDVYFGPEYSQEEMERALKKFNLAHRQSNNLEKEIAQFIKDKKIVGYFSGRMEYGPRALGSRSILAEPTDPSINDWLNKRLARTEFMPFAPVVLEEDAPDLFGNFEPGRYPSYFMTITFDFKKKWKDKLAAVYHVDGTARPQVVAKDQNPQYYKIIEEFKKLTGLPAIINTSFNMHEEPIVCTPVDAIRAHLQGSVDVLIMDKFVIEKKEK